MRFVVSIAVGTVVAVLLFLLMHSLISGRSAIERDDDSAVRLDFIKVAEEELTNVKRRTPPPKPKPVKKPPPPKVTIPKPDQPVREMPRIEVPRVALGLSTGSGPYLGSWTAGDATAEGDVIPIVRIEPQYPREALIKGVSGWVEVEFTIEPDGSVSDPKVLAAEPPRIFERNAIRAIYKWKFKPRIVDGKAVARRATQRLDFNLNN